MKNLEIPSKPISNAKTTVLIILNIVCWVVFLYFESTQPPATFIGLLPHLDKAAHFVAFGILALLICNLTFKLKPMAGISLFTMPFLITSLLGAGEEILQKFVPGRTPSIPDFLADVSGAMFAIFLANVIKYKTQAKQADVEN